MKKKFFIALLLGLFVGSLSSPVYSLTFRNLLPISIDFQCQGYASFVVQGKVTGERFDLSQIQGEIRNGESISISHPSNIVPDRNSELWIYPAHSSQEAIKVNFYNLVANKDTQIVEAIYSGLKLKIKITCRQESDTIIEFSLYDS